MAETRICNCEFGDDILIVEAVAVDVARDKNGHKLAEIPNWNTKKTATFEVACEEVDELCLMFGIKPVTNPNEIVNIEIVVPDKVTKVYFADGTVEKMVVQKPDVFNMEECLYIALAKKLYRGTKTLDGIEFMSKLLPMEKEYAGIVHRGMKIYKAYLKEQEKVIEEQKRLEKKRAKRHAYKERRKERWEQAEAKRIEDEKKRQAEEREEQIQMQTEAFVRAMRILEEEKMKDCNCNCDCDCDCEREG